MTLISEYNCSSSRVAARVYEAGDVNQIEIGQPFSKKSVKITLSKGHCDVRTQFSEHCGNVDMRSVERVIKISNV